MTWRDDLRRVSFKGLKFIGASFRGVPFFVESASRSGGRRQVVHEFPLKDDPYNEDLGRKARAFNVEGYVIGDDYLEQRDKLLAALEDVEGPGELVHPYDGRRTVSVGAVNVQDRRPDGGMAMFTIEFADAPAQSAAAPAVVDGPEQVAISADAAVVASEAEFVARYNPLGLPAFAIASAEGALTRAVEVLGAVLSPVVNGSQELAELTGRIALLGARASTLVRQPTSILGEFRSAITGLVQAIATSPGGVMRGLIAAYGGSPERAVVPITATRARELENQTALLGGLRQAIAIEAARLAPLVPYASIDEATTARDQVAAMLEEQAAGAGDGAYPALVKLRSEVLRAVPGGTAFASVVSVTRPVAVPSLLLAYQLYGSVDRELDIIARNKTPHPGFVAGTLQVLSDDDVV